MFSLIYQDVKSWQKINTLTNKLRIAENKGYSIVPISLTSKLSELKIMKWLLVVLNFELTRPVFPTI